MLALHKLFHSKGLIVRYVSESTTPGDRKSIVDDFTDGRLPILLNVEVFTEDVNFLQVDSVFMVRPTRSQSLVTQMIESGLRLHADKEQCLVVDFVDGFETSLPLNISVRAITSHSNGGSTARISTDGELNGDVVSLPIEEIDGVDNMFRGTGDLGFLESISPNIGQCPFNWEMNWCLHVAPNRYFKIQHAYCRRERG
ncbi:unnamed protein product [Ambrosiozyma monospora]|uniref:Unnamed protein product n=1 Tax=Ambrosiozyma monospora TaxID=43982 RepID=A0ACB5T7C3_AMBMO|nr:unnamed protein product [Ambrosiozyma monospora]